MSQFHSYADYELPLLEVLAELPGGQGMSKEVRDRFGERFADRIPEEHKVFLENVREVKWRNIVAWVRNTLIKRKLMDAPEFNVWRITEAGRAHLLQAGPSLKPTAPPSGRPATVPRPASASNSAGRTIEFSVGGHKVDLSSDHVLNVARREIAQGLPAEAHDYYSWVVEVDGQKVGVKWLFGLVTGIPHADFQSSQARRAFERLGLTIRQDRSGGIDAKADRLPSAPQNGLRSEVYSIIASKLAAVHDFLNGRTARPSDERLCDWVHLCYDFELYREGKELFALVDPAQVNPWYYGRAKRLAKVCDMKLAGYA